MVRSEPASLPEPAHGPRPLLKSVCYRDTPRGTDPHTGTVDNQSPDRVFRSERGGRILLMVGSIRVALVNDYEIVLQGLRALLEPYAPDIAVVELDVNATPARTVDVTLLDTYGEATGMREQVQTIASDPSNGAIVVFSFADD